MEKIEKVKKFIKEHKPDLSISRVPPNTLETFKKLATSEFCNDYGMTLKWLVDYITQDIKYLELSRRIAILEEKILVSEEKPIKLLNGRIIKKPRR